MVPVQIRDRKVGGSNPLAPTTLTSRNLLAAVRGRDPSEGSDGGSGSSRVVNAVGDGAAERAVARVSAGRGGSDAPPAGEILPRSSAGGGPKLRRWISFLR